MLDPAVVMLTSMRRTNNEAKTNNETKKSTAKVTAGYPAANLPLEYAISTCMGLQAISNLRQSQSATVSLQESEEFLDLSFSWAK